MKIEMASLKSTVGGQEKERSTQKLNARKAKKQQSNKLRLLRLNGAKVRRVIFWKLIDTARRNAAKSGIQIAN
jgi:hypothetical protein